MSALWLDLLALLVYGPAIVLLHELGHAAAAPLGGYRVTDFAVGWGKPLLRLELRGGAVVHLDRVVLAGGSCTAIPVGPPTTRRVWFHLGGLFAQILLVLPLLFFLEHRVVQHVLLFNALVMAHNALPWRIGAMASDGWHVLDALGGSGRTANVLSHHAALVRMTERAELVGSRLGVAYGRICLAWAEVIGGRPDQASSLFREDPPETTLDPWVDALYHYVRAEWDRTQGRALGALRTAREAHLAVDLSQVGDASALIALAEARALVDLDAPAQAMRALSRTAGVGGAIGWQASATLVWASLEAEPDDLELAAWRLIRRLHEPCYDPADGAMALWAAAETLTEQGRDQPALAARKSAMELADRALIRCPQPLRASLRQRLGPVAGSHPPSAARGGR